MTTIPDAFYSGKDLRLARLSSAQDARYLFVPMDHSISDGPITSAAAFNRLVGAVVAGGADAIIVHKGRARMIDPRQLRTCSLVLHLSASTAHAPDNDAKVLVATVEDAVRLSADAVSVHVNIGSATEADQIKDLGRVATECQRWNLPLLAMIYPRGPRIRHPGDPKLISHLVNIAADLGVDLVKTTAAAPLAAMAEVVRSCPVPLLVAGGPQRDGDVIAFARGAMDAGCGGLAIGRRVFTDPDPHRMVRDLATIVHPTPGALFRDQAYRGGSAPSPND